MIASISVPISSQVSAPSYEPMVTSYWLFDFFFSHGELPLYRSDFFACLMIWRSSGVIVVNLAT